MRADFGKGRGHGWLLALVSLGICVSVAAQPPADDRQRYQLGLEVKGHFRSSTEIRFPSPFRFNADMLPVGQNRGFLETVEAGDHFEFSAVTLWATAQWRPSFSGKLKIDLIDRYDRNPTSEDREIDIDEAWLRFGRETEPGSFPEGRGAYAKIGKFPKFERQDDRHLESYGLISTAFNRLEDVGLEIGFDLSRHFYVKAQVTEGNPLFFREPNALAGDNGIALLNGSVRNPDPELKSGFPIFYDADVDDIGFEEPEVGLGLGLRFGTDDELTMLDFLAWAYERELADTVDLGGTFYGGDLDLLFGPGNSTPLPVSNRDKQEIGANLWVYSGGFSFFGQFVDQDLAGLDRTGYEGEIAWSFDLPLFWAIGGNQVFAWIAPAVRYSKLEPDFTLDEEGRYPAPSVIWDWEKIDVGVRLGLYKDSDLTLEYQDNNFIRLGREESNDEFLATVRIGFDRGLGDIVSSR